MSKGLKNLEYRGGKDELLFFICDIVSTNHIKIQDAEIICSHAHGKRNLVIKDLISYCLSLGWIKIESDIISVSSSLIPLLQDKEKLNYEMVKSTVEQLFAEELLDSTMFCYDAVHCCYSFKNELFPLDLSCVRNVLINQGFLERTRESQGIRFYIAHSYDSLIAKQCKIKHRQLSLEKLKKQIEEEEIAGEKAELFVMDYEKERIGQPLCDNILRISEIDVTAGYDIVSFNSSQSQTPDRFIEVKAKSTSGFFWSRNEYEIAKLKGETYYLYLVDLRRILEPNYIPEIIQNPALCIMASDEWIIESQSYHIKHI